MDVTVERSIGDITTVLDTWFPEGLAESWDNVGLLLGDTKAPVRKVMTCLTVTPESGAEALALGVDLIITHHPILFRAVKRLIADGPNAVIYSLARAGVAVYSPHTAFDGAADGINTQIAQRIGLTKILPLRPLPCPIENSASLLGAGRWGVLSHKITTRELAGLVQEKLHSRATSFVVAGKDSIRKVAIGCGAGMDFLADAVRSGCDAFITGEGRFHQMLEAQELGISVILAGHYATERFAVETLALRLAAHFPDLSVWASQKETDPLTTLLP